MQIISAPQFFIDLRNQRGNYDDKTKLGGAAI